MAAAGSRSANLCFFLLVLVAVSALAESTSLIAGRERRVLLGDDEGGGEEGENADEGAAAAAEGASAPRTARRRSYVKERVRPININQAASVLDEVIVPRTPQWDDIVKRVIMTRKNPILPASFPKANMLTPEMTSKLMYLYPEEDVSTEYDTCAVVGNAGMLRNDNYGDAIDAHDVVIRFNDGPTTNWTQYAGSRTSFRIINNFWSRRYKWTRPAGAFEENLMLFSFSTLPYLAKVKERFDSPEERVVYMAPEVAMNARRSYNNAYEILKKRDIIKVNGRNAAPTGIEGVYMALHICKHTNVYGFDIEGMDGFPYHYFDEFRGTGSAHSFKYQALFLKMLQRKGKLQLCVPKHANKWCKLDTCESCKQELPSMGKSEPLPVTRSMSASARVRARPTGGMRRRPSIPGLRARSRAP